MAREQDVEQELVSEYIEDSDEARREFERLLPLIPFQEPANGGPTGAQFMSQLSGMAERVRTRPRIKAFPCPTLTSGGYQTKG
ncbi:hypothetical protein DEW08_15035 [Azospirillum thermophilum]|uniref:Uncharacterized protein n=1 Tax=Azospirillum thermophilum TaxID=2202148 RepID=A0A2S2CSF5_9PROT|nr:hypothetical protein DEW08_15035 [Azospirillum thermophilum]